MSSKVYSRKLHRAVRRRDRPTIGLTTIAQRFNAGSINENTNSPGRDGRFILSCLTALRRKQIWNPSAEALGYFLQRFARARAAKRRGYRESSASQSFKAIQFGSACQLA
jgi:hypothetical protein